MGWGLLLLIILYMGFRPISYVFGDMGTYARMYDSFQTDGNVLIIKDKGFYIFTKFLAGFNSKTLYFFSITLIYVIPLFILVKKLFPNYYYFAFLVIVGSFSFWPYGTNGLRNGVATSLLMLSFAFYNKKWIMYSLFIIAYTFHSSLLLPISAFILVSLFRNYNLYLYGWFFSIILSLIFGSYFENMVTNLGVFNDDRFIIYFQEKDTYNDFFASDEFRWDFLIYSSIPIIISYYFIVKKGFKDKFYIHISNTYLLANSFWVLIIKASYSNRFAYLSWFLMGLVIIYPLLKKVYWRNQFAVIGLLTLFYFSFNYIMNVILA